ncbi:hypothetical protein [Psychromicrobium lacuslunae]|uniref:Uncharacterized protein n=1 Tax=Psychromicrobium lacuslunae TaxID=1618207 RepID=A0A0D4BZP1_9MICC|nr:hypothetical protein [Psychromicrobium lacuslunae]AJT41605.1 hypothetical protein UM93_08915 [Psychromicrobium lacuslunae]
MSSVRLLVASFSTPQDPVLHSWLVHRSRVLGETHYGSALEKSDGFDPEEHIFVWRLLTSNNRELARSAAIFKKFSEARDDAAETQRSIQDLAHHSVIDADQGTHTWLAFAAEEPKVFGARWFRMERDRDKALHNALIAFSSARLPESAHAAGLRR